MPLETICMSGAFILLPLIVGLAAPHSLAQWGYVFIGLAAFQLASVCIFAVTCDSRPRKWTKAE
jgi:hypothetical protein